MVKWIKSLFRTKTEREAYLREQERAADPWAVFEVGGFEADGRVKVLFHWNKSFINKIKTLGFEAETEEDCVQLFFYASQMRPTQLAIGDDPVQSNEHPNLSQQQNMLRT